MEEEMFLHSEKKTCFNSYYPFGILARKNIEKMELEPFTILYGGNGCGKTTILNVIAEKLQLKRESDFNKTSFLKHYLEFCDYRMKKSPSNDSRIITSDDVFDHILNLRKQNGKIDFSREQLFDQYSNNRRKEFRLDSLENYEQLKDVNLSRKFSKSQYVHNKLGDNLRELSNGESALNYFSQKVTQDSLYLLDEPENSLSAENQLKLARFLEDSYRFYNCQFIISTHSPFLLSVHGAKVYDMDEPSFCAKKWTDLKNVRIFYDFFLKHSNEF